MDRAAAMLPPPWPASGGSCGDGCHGGDDSGGCRGSGGGKRTRGGTGERRWSDDGCGARCDCRRAGGWVGQPPGSGAGLVDLATWTRRTSVAGLLAATKRQPPPSGPCSAAAARGSWPRDGPQKRGGRWHLGGEHAAQPGTLLLVGGAGGVPPLVPTSAPPCSPGTPPPPGGGVVAYSSVPSPTSTTPKRPLSADGRSAAVVPGAASRPTVATAAAGHQWSPLAVDMAAGAVAGLACDAVMHPMDTIKARLQAQRGPPWRYRGIVHCATRSVRDLGTSGGEEGATLTPARAACDLCGGGAVARCHFGCLPTALLAHLPNGPTDAAPYAPWLRPDYLLLPTGFSRGMYAGFGAVLIGTPFTHALMFGAYREAARELTSDSAPPFGLSPYALSMLLTLTTASFGEAISLATYVPTEVIAKRMQVAAVGPGRHYRNALHAFSSIARVEGPRGLYAGAAATALRDIPYTAVQLALYEAGKSLVLGDGGVPDPTGDDGGGEGVGFGVAGALGAAAGGVAAAITNPLDVVKTRLQTQPGGAERMYAGVLDCMRRVVREEGWAALGRGVGARVAWVAPSSAIVLAVFEAAGRALGGDADAETSAPL